MLEPGSRDRAGRARLRGSLTGLGAGAQGQRKGPGWNADTNCSAALTAPETPALWLGGKTHSLTPLSFTGSPEVPTPALSASATP